MGRDWKTAYCVVVSVTSTKAITLTTTDMYQARHEARARYLTELARRGQHYLNERAALYTGGPSTP